MFKIYNFLTHFDFLTPGINLNLNKREKQGNLIGFSLTMIAIIFTLLSRYILIKECFKGINPSIKEYEVKTTLNDTSIVDIERIIVAFYEFDVFNEKLIPINLTSIIDPFVLSQNYENNVFNTNFLGRSVVCDKEKLNSGILLSKDFDNTTKNVISNYGICIKLANKTDTSISFKNNENVVLSFNLNNTKTMFIYVDIFFQGNYFNQNNYNDPFSKKWEKRSFTTTQGLNLIDLVFKKYTFNINNFSFIFESVRDDIIYYNLNEVDLVASFPQLEQRYDIFLRLFQSVSNSNIEIRYITMDDVISNLGGSFSVIFFLTSCIYSYVFQFIQNIELLNQTFNISLNNEVSNCKISGTKKLEDTFNNNPYKYKGLNFSSVDRFVISEIKEPKNIDNLNLENNTDENIEYNTVKLTQNKNIVSNMKTDVFPNLNNFKKRTIKRYNTYENKTSKYSNKMNNSLIKEIDIMEKIKEGVIEEKRIFKFSYLDGIKYFHMPCFYEKEIKKKYYDAILNVIENNLDINNLLGIGLKVNFLSNAVFSFLGKNGEIFKNLIHKQKTYTSVNCIYSDYNSSNLFENQNMSSLDEFETKKIISEYINKNKEDKTRLYDYNNNDRHYFNHKDCHVNHNNKASKQKIDKKGINFKKDCKKVLKNYKLFEETIMKMVINKME